LIGDPGELAVDLMWRPAGQSESPWGTGLEPRQGRLKLPGAWAYDERDDLHPLLGVRKDARHLLLPDVVGGEERRADHQHGDLSRAEGFLNLLLPVRPHLDAGVPPNVDQLLPLEEAQVYAKPCEPITVLGAVTDEHPSSTHDRLPATRGR